MAKDAGAGGSTPLPEEIIVWEILVHVPPKSLLRFRSVCRAWRRATSTDDFLLAHHSRQPSLPVVSSSSYNYRSRRYENIHVFDHRAAQLLTPVARLDDSSCPLACCDGLLLLSKCGMQTGTGFSVFNPATRQHAPLLQLSGFDLLAMYRHRPTGEYRLLLHRSPIYPPYKDRIGCYVLTLGSDQPPRNIGGLEVAESAYLHTPALLHDSLHWYPVLNYQSDPPHPSRPGSKVVIVFEFDTTSESSRQMRAPVVPAESYIFEMDATLGIYSHDEAMGFVDIWVLQNYHGEVWHHEYHVELPVTEIKRQFGRLADSWFVSVVSVDRDVLLLVTLGGWMFYVDVDGKLVDNFHHDRQTFHTCDLRLKQTLVPHTFFTSLEGYSLKASPFV